MPALLIYCYANGIFSSRRSERATDRAGELEEQSKLDIAELLKQAEQADQSDGEEGQRLPEEIQRRQKLRQARAQLEAQAKARAEAERGEYGYKLAEREQRPLWVRVWQSCVDDPVDRGRLSGGACLTPQRPGRSAGFI